MKKLIITCLVILFLVGCSMNISTPKDKVKAYLERYIKNDASIMTQLDEFIGAKDYTLENKELYKSVLEKQYKDLKYEIIDEEKDNNSSLVTVKITVYDLYKVQNKTEAYLSTNHEDFVDKDGIFDNSKYIKYQLEEMKLNTDTVDYTIIFIVNKVNNDWVVETLSEEELEKIHGIYNYENK